MPTVDTVTQVQYRDEFVAGFEQRVSLLRSTCTTEVVIQGLSAIFMVADSGSEEAVTRGANGNIPTQADAEEQFTCTLQEWHSLARKNRFNIFTGQSNQRQVMQMNTMARINRRIDNDIITALSAGTQNAGAAQTANLALVTKAKGILGLGEVPMDGRVFALITPAFLSYLEQTTEFSSQDYINTKPLPDGMPSWSDKIQTYKWLGINWIVHPRLPGAGTASETCFLYHMNAIGHAVDTEAINTAIGYNDEQDYSYARATGFFGSKLLQNTGVVKMLHDGSAVVAS